MARRQHADVIAHGWKIQPDFAETYNALIERSRPSLVSAPPVCAVFAALNACNVMYYRHMVSPQFAPISTDQSTKMTAPAPMRLMVKLVGLWKTTTRLRPSSPPKMIPTTSRRDLSRPCHLLLRLCLPSRHVTQPSFAVVLNLAPIKCRDPDREKEENSWVVAGAEEAARLSSRQTMTLWALSCLRFKVQRTTPDSETVSCSNFLHRSLSIFESDTYWGGYGSFCGRFIWQEGLPNTRYTTFT
jgi:hypothetical protein